MITVTVKFTGEPEQMVGPFGQVGESLRWISKFKEVLYLNFPDKHASLSTHVIHDPVQAMTWAASTSHKDSTNNVDHTRVHSEDPSW